MPLCRRGADGIDTIQVDIWTSLLPPENYTAPTVWQDVEAPDGRVYARTGQFGLALNVTLLNATTYLVRVDPSSGVKTLQLHSRAAACRFRKQS